MLSRVDIATASGCAQVDHATNILKYTSTPSLMSYGFNLISSW
jgi:hypothetical protein